MYTTYKKWHRIFTMLCTSGATIGGTIQVLHLYFMAHNPELSIADANLDLILNRVLMIFIFFMIWIIGHTFFIRMEEVTKPVHKKLKQNAYQGEEVIPVSLR